MLVVPGVFADRQGNLLAAEIEQLLALGGGEIAHLVEDIVGRKQHLRLDEFDAAGPQQSRRVHHRLAGIGMSRSDKPADHRNSLRFGGNLLDALAVARNKRWTLDEVARRISADG